MSLLLYWTVLGFMAFSAISPVSASHLKEIKTCFDQDKELSIASSATASCFKDFIDVQIQGNSGNKNCTLFEDFREKYSTFLAQGVKLCVNETIQERFESQKNNLLDFFEFSMENDTLKKFVANDGISCITQIAKDINNCVASQGKVLSAVNATWRWTRRTQLLFDSTSCTRTSKIKDCMQTVLQRNCNQSSTDYVLGLFDFVLQNEKYCNNTSNAQEILPFITETTSSFPVWAYCLIVLGGLLIIAVITLIIVKKKSTKYDFLLSFHKGK